MGFKTHSDIKKADSRLINLQSILIFKHLKLKNYILQSNIDI